MSNILIQLLVLLATVSVSIKAFTSTRGFATSIRDSTAIYANPINSDGSKYRGDITEEEAFLWFDEAMVSVTLIPILWKQSRTESSFLGSLHISVVCIVLITLKMDENSRTDWKLRRMCFVQLHHHLLHVSFFKHL